MPSDATKRSQPRRIFRQVNNVIEANHAVLESGGKLKKYRGAVDGSEGQDFELRLSVVQNQVDIVEKFSDTPEQYAQLQTAAKGWKWDEDFPKVYLKHLQKYDHDQTEEGSADDVNEPKFVPTSSMHESGGQNEDVSSLSARDNGSFEAFGRLKRELAALQDAHKLVKVDLVKSTGPIVSSENADTCRQKPGPALKAHLADLSTEVGLLRTISIKAAQIAESTAIYDRVASMMAQIQENQAMIEALRSENNELKREADKKRLKDGSVVAGLDTVLQALKKEIDEMRDAGQAQAGSTIIDLEGAPMVKPRGPPTHRKRKRDLTDDGETSEDYL
ncbi:hypothetical protein Tdes44962_MAKER01565 [Teratosphaeria destructans]|uniref:Uncharacterized protein n=1 Tax=Teratosphaeria destructans TaxID=418781 RepID=A0A9W7SYS8_9PEZI|nr:hypothetical protein Tdes44962_MAKER01565 [Teratosphaeria destructans]